VIETRYVPCEAAKMRFEYTLYNAATKEIVCTGSSVQVFLDKQESALQLTVPSFFNEWKKQWGLI
jgi:acyl-CoA thioester hydrolase